MILVGLDFIDLFDLFQLLGLIWLLIILIEDSKYGSNKWGLNPKGNGNDVILMRLVYL